ncbi:MAG: autotransporter-associated beta strand repeat-containing protein [Verrucomicrobiota bacterium]
MKTRVPILKLLTILCGTLATTAVFGQVVYTWTGAGDGTNIVTAANWSPAGGPPSGANQDTGQWDNQVPGNLIITYNNGLPSTGYGTEGIILDLTTNQVGSVAIVPVGGSTGNIGLFVFADYSATAAFSLGDNSANILNFIGRPAGAVHDFVNNSSAAATVYPNVRWQAGGGATYTLLFDGTGNWNVTNSLCNANNTGILISKGGPGTMYWNGPSISGALGNSGINSPITISNGTMVLEWNNVLIATDSITNNGVLDFDAPSQAQTLAGIISGSGELMVSAGTLTLQGENIYSGNTVLAGGILILKTNEMGTPSGPLGVSNLVTFGGGTLQFSVNNTYDYSSRFDPSANQAYNFNTAGQLVTFTNGLTSSGGTLTKGGAGTLTLAGSNTYSGLTTVNAGTLAFAGPKTGSGNITVADGAILAITATGTPVTPATLTMGTSSGASLEFNNVNSTTATVLAAGTISSAGTLTVNINSGTFTVGQSYPLFSWTSGSAPAVSLGTLNGYIGNLSVSGNTLSLNVTGTAYAWTGANSGNWDLTTQNWIQNGGPAAFANGGPALFDDTATGATNVTITALVQPSSVTVNNNRLIYSITSSFPTNDIGGSTGLTMSGNKTLTLSGGANTYTGVTTFGAGTVSVSGLANGGSASDIGAANKSASSLVFNSGTLQYTGGGAIIDRLFTLGLGGGTIDASGSAALALANTGPVAFSGAGPRTLILTGNGTDTNTLAAELTDNGGPTSVTKSGAGTWVLTGTNTYSGVTTIAGGELQVGAGGAAGSLGTGTVTDDGILDFNVTGTLTVGTISGTGSVINDGSGTVILPGNNTYSGGTTINAGTVQIGNGGTTGSLYLSGPVVDNGMFIFNSKGSLSLTSTGVISGSGNVLVEGSGGLLKAIGNNTYTGWTTINSGATFQPCEGNQGALVSSVVTNNGTLKLVRQDNGVFVYSGNIVGTGSVLKDCNNPNNGDVTLSGSNTYTGGTFINGGFIILGDGSTPGAGTIVGNVSMTYNTLNTVPSTFEFNHPDDMVFTNVISGAGSVTQEGGGRVTLTGANTYSNGTTTVSAGVLQVGAGGTSGSIGTNNVTDNSELDFDLSANLTFPGVISGSGSVVQLGSGTLTLTGSNTYSGATIVSNGTLVLNVIGEDGTNAVGGDMDVSGGTLVPAAVGTVGTLNVAGNMYISSGTIVVALNKSLSQSNSMISVAGSTLTNSGGTLKLLNFGPNVVAGDQFAIFNQAVTGAVMTVVSPGFTVANNLALNGSVKVSTVASPGTDQVTATISGGQINLSWPAIYTGLHLQTQVDPVKYSTNAVAGITKNWVTIAGTDAGNSYSAPVQMNVCVFYRLAP